MKIANYEVEIVQCTVTVFEKGMEQPFNDWSDAAYAQGVSWRDGSVSFSVFNDCDPAIMTAEFVLAESAAASATSERVIQVPFRVGAKAQVDISGIYEAADRAVPVPAGDYCLTFELSRTQAATEDEDARISGIFTFSPGTCKPKVIKADADLNPPSELVLDGKAA